jgi:tetratricopeptide (TPR) repeat protein
LALAGPTGGTEAIPTEGLRWVESALRRSEGEQTVRRAKVLAAGAMFAYRNGDLERLKTYATESLEVARTTGDERNTTWPLIFLGLWATEAGCYDEATSRYEEATAVAREAGDQKLLGVIFNNLGVVAMQQMDFVGAAGCFEKAMAISRELRTPDELAVETVNFAWCLHYTGRSSEAAQAAKEGLTLALGNDSLMAHLVLFAALARQQGNADVAARLLGAAEELRSRVGNVPGGADEDLEMTTKEVVAALGADLYAKKLVEGRGMSVDEAVEYALASQSDSPRLRLRRRLPPPASGSAGTRTRR